MDFSAIKALIQQNIRTNNNEDITGNVLQQVLLGMIETLGDDAINDILANVDNIEDIIQDILNGGYGDCGVYDISDNHGGASYASLSAALGTNGINISEGLRKDGMSVKFVNSSTHKYVQYRYLQVYENTTAGNAAFLNTDNWQKQGADVSISLNKTTGHNEIAIGKESTPTPSLSDIWKLWLENGKTFEPLESVGYMVNDGSINKNGTPYHCKYIDFIVKQGEKYQYKGYGTASAYSLVIFDSSNAVISSVKYNSQTSYVEITIPNNGVFARFSSFALSDDDIVFDVVKKDSFYNEFTQYKEQMATKTEVNKISMSVNSNNLYTEQLGYLNSSGEYVGTGSYHSKSLKLDCKEGDVFYYKGRAETSTRSYVVFNASNTVISSGIVGSKTEWGKCTIPANAAYVIFSSFELIGDNIVFEVRNGDNVRFVIDDLIKDIYPKVNKVSMSINSNIIFTEQLGYLNSGGTYSNTSSFHSKSLKVDCKEGDVFYYKGRAENATRSYVVFNASNVVIDSGIIGSKTMWGKCTMPTNTSYVIFSSFELIGGDIVFEVRNGDNIRFVVDDLVKDIYPKISSPFKESRAGYMRDDGTFTSDQGFHCEYIDYMCNSGDVFFYRGKGFGNGYCWVIFDSSNNVIVSEQVDSVDELIKIVIPTNGVKIRLSSFNFVEDPVDWEAVSDKTLYGRVDYLYNRNVTDVLWGKKWLAVGDSFTNGDFTGDTTGTYLFESGRYAGLKKVYPRFVALRNDMNLVMDAINGSTMAVQTAYVDNPQDDPRSPYAYQRYLNIPQDVDYITIWFGINDQYNCTLGTIDDNTIGTFYGAWNVVLEWILTNRPNAKIGIVITNVANSTFREAERDIALKWGIPYLDMMGNPQVPDIFGKDSAGYSSTARQLRTAHWRVSAENGHPNQFCHEYESTFIENWLRTL